MERATVDIYDQRGLAVGGHPRHRRSPGRGRVVRRPGRRRCRPPRRRVRGRALPALPGLPGGGLRRIDGHARRLPRPRYPTPSTCRETSRPSPSPGITRRCLVVDDPPPRPPAPAAHGPVGPAPGPRAWAARSSVQVLEGGYEGDDLPGDEVGGRFFAGWEPDRLVDVVVGAGFDVDERSLTVSGDEVRLRAVRARTLADTVGPGMRLLVCGVNPSLVLGRCRGRLRPARQPVLGRGPGRGHRVGRSRRPIGPR